MAGDRWFGETGHGASVRRTARGLGLSTDASYRFERGADIEASVPALNRAASLIVDWETWSRSRQGSPRKVPAKA